MISVVSSIVICFEVNESIADISTKLFIRPRKSKSRSTSGSTNFHNFFTIYVSEVKESIAKNPSKLPYIPVADLRNPGLHQLQ